MKGKKILIATILLVVIMGSGISVAASLNVSGLFTEWFQSKNNDAIKEIDKAVDGELEEQTKRLQQELKPLIESAKKNIDTYKSEQKQEAINELQTYADQLIKNVKTADPADNSIDKEKYEKELNDIVNTAKSQLEKIKPKKKRTNMQTIKEQDGQNINE